MSDKKGLYLLHVSMHGLVRGKHMELGRDPDTGGQIKYVVELAQALADSPEVEELDLVTRKIIDPRFSDDYARDREKLGDHVNIVRLECGPNRYIRKESLWPYMDNFADAIVDYLRKKGRVPDLIHGHYADAGYVCSRVAGLLEIPMAFTGHSLGRVKEKRLLEQGTRPANIEKNYNISTRIEGEEWALDSADFVVASTKQEVQEQYRLYSNYQPRRMSVIPPGVDLSTFQPNKRGLSLRPPAIQREIERFLSHPKKPVILALSRPDPKKNVLALLKAYAENSELNTKANLVLILGNRDELKDLTPAARKLFYEMFLLIDRYDLYGKVAVPKHHKADDVPEIYRYAARTKGLFVNPALTEPFGLTILEAAASGLPVVATKNGGAKEILEKCRNGMLLDPYDTGDIGTKLLAALTNRKQWNRWVKAGLANSQKFYSWQGHVKKYVATVQKEIGRRKGGLVTFNFKKRLATFDRVLVSDIDDTLVGDREPLVRLLEMLKDAGDKVSFGIATGRSLPLAMEALKEWNVPMPNFLVTSVGSEVYYGPNSMRDAGWQQHINYRWNPDVVRQILKGVPGIKPQGPKGQGAYKVSYFMDPQKAPTVDELTRRLRKAGVNAKVIFSHGQYLDVIPVRSSKGLAIRYLAMKWNIPFDRVLVAGDSGNDLDMLTGNMLGVVVGNYSPELEVLRGRPDIYIAKTARAEGIIEGIEHYDFFGNPGRPTMEEN